MSWKTSLLIRSKISELFLNTLTADEKNSRHNRENLPQPIQMQLSQKAETFCRNFVAFLKSTKNFERFEKKNMSLTAEVFPKIFTPKNVVT